MLRVIATALALFFTGAALADDWKEYENQDYSFTIHFPVDPTDLSSRRRAFVSGAYLLGEAGNRDIQGDSGRDAR
jgi:hypothetical protein